MKGLKKIIWYLIPLKIKRFIDARRYSKIAKEKWIIEGRPVPPPHIIKQEVIKAYSKNFGLRILVETGTYLGDMVWAQKKVFKTIFSIELGAELWKNAKQRFADYSYIHIIHGDSGKVLDEQVLSKISERSLFWLDGHYSSGITAKGEVECPIFEELDAIFSSGIRHVILVDDARCFNGTRDYPTIETLKIYITDRYPTCDFSVEDDIIRIVY